MHLISAQPLCLRQVFYGPGGRRHNRLQHLYNIYCKNKPRADHVIDTYRDVFEKMRVTLKEKFGIKDMLIAPVSH